ncbi:MAG: sigma-70 family RNA polymerase sigma factor [Bacteroidetes bacterium]|nr:sigma-70 family RNA polymerase sigma factor [Bacteroidota bacterium]
MKPAVDQVLKEFGQRLYRLCHSYYYRVEDVGDLYQEMLINVWRSYDQFRGDSSLSTWIYRVAVNTALMHVRKEQVRRDRFQPFDATVHDQAGHTEENPQLDQLRLAISRLEPADRVIITLVLEGQSYEDIAGITGLTTNHVGVKINRIKQKLLRSTGHES